MDLETYTIKAEHYLRTLCAVRPNRRTGSAGNREAAEFFAQTVRRLGYTADTTPFACLDYVREDVQLTQAGRSFDVLTSPYSLGCDVTAELLAVSTVEALKNSDCRGKILLMHGELCTEQIMPKNFVFYNPEHHQQLIALLEEKRAAAIITATARSPEMVGALYPFPLFLDGDFDIPSVYCTDVVGQDLVARQGKQFSLIIQARRIPSQAANIVARLNPGALRKIVVTAHIDAYEDSPGAIDNASGTAVLLLLAEMLAGYKGPYAIEITAFNGEDHYSAAGQMDYLQRYAQDLASIKLAINVDGVGYRKGRAAYSLYGCPPQIEQNAEDAFAGFDGLVRGDPWFSGDHMIFVQHGVPCIALTAERIADLMHTVVHTAEDTPQLIDLYKLVEIAYASAVFIKLIT